MNKNEFKKEVQEVLVGLGFDVSKDKAVEVSDAIFQRVADLVVEGEEVPVGVIGKITSTERAARKGHNPSTGEAIDIPASVAPKAKFSKAFKDTLKNKQ